MTVRSLLHREGEDELQRAFRAAYLTCRGARDSQVPHAPLSHALHVHASGQMEQPLPALTSAGDGHSRARVAPPEEVQG